jgi:hypothetical protein
LKNYSTSHHKIIELPDYIRVGKDDLIEQYLFLTTSDDGYGSISAAFTPVRIVCANTFNAAVQWIEFWFPVPAI